MHEKENLGKSLAHGVINWLKSGAHQKKLTIVLPLSLSFLKFQLITPYFLNNALKRSEEVKLKNND
jgi:hypothetical protein